MNQDIIKKHTEMVLRLAKPGDAILKSLTAWDCDFAHMGGCLPGEASELFDAINEYLDNGKTERKDLVEELGDFAFYLVKCSSFFGRDWHGKVHPWTSPVRNATELMRLGGHFWDPVKRVTIYRKDIGGPDKKYPEHLTIAAACVHLLNKMEEHFNALITYFDLTLEEILEGNWTKLADADKGRFASGSYSDEQAQDRKDKMDLSGTKIEPPPISYDESVNQHITARKKL